MGRRACCAVVLAAFVVKSRYSSHSDISFREYRRGFKAFDVNKKLEISSRLAFGKI